MPAWLWDEIHEQFRKFFHQDRLKGDVLATEFFEGDTVALTGTIGGKSHRNGHQAVKVDGRPWTDTITVAEDKLQLIKRAELPNGTIIKMTITGNRYIRRAGRWDKLARDGATSVPLTQPDLNANPFVVLDR